MSKLLILCLVACAYAQVLPSNYVGFWNGAVYYSWLTAGGIPSCCPFIGNTTAFAPGGVPLRAGQSEVLTNVVSINVIDEETIQFTTPGPNTPNTIVTTCGSSGLNSTVDIAVVADRTGEVPNCYQGSVDIVGNAQFQNVPCPFVFDIVTGGFAIDLIYCAAQAQQAMATVCPGAAGRTVAPTYCTELDINPFNAVSQWVTNFNAMGGVVPAFRFVTAVSSSSAGAAVSSSAAAVSSSAAASSSDAAAASSSDAAAASSSDAAAGGSSSAAARSSSSAAAAVSSSAAAVSSSAAAVSSSAGTSTSDASTVAPSVALFVAALAVAKAVY